MQMTESNDDSLKRPIVPEVVPEGWIRQIEDASKGASITMVCGRSLSGKSIFCRRLLNRYLTGLGKNAASLPSVYFLDLDASKPTHSPHGQVSLVLVRKVDLAPPFLNASTPPSSPNSNEIIHAFPLPIGTLSNYEDYFVSCVDNFIRIYSQSSLRYPGIPLVINTPGWLYSSGFDLLLRSISRAKPQRLIYLSDPDSMNDEDGLRVDALNRAARKEKTLVQEISAHTLLTARSHTDQQVRSMQMLSYFHSDNIAKSNHLQAPVAPKPISSYTPWEFCYEDTDDMDQSILGFLSLEEWADPDQIPAILSGAIVQIVRMDENIDEELANLSRTELHGIPFFEPGPDSLIKYVNPSSAQLLCTALLRGWDFDHRIAQLLIPKSHEALVCDLEPRKTVLIFGCCEYPEWAYAEDAYHELANITTGTHAADSMVANGNITIPSWVAPAATSDQMGYLNVPRRVRKFQQ